MGCSASTEKTVNSVHENMLATVLSGGTVAEDDYLARSHKILEGLAIVGPDNNIKGGGSKDFMNIENVHMMLEPESQPLEDCYYRQSDGCWFIACRTDLGTECNGKMFDWWYCNISSSNLKWWHPKNYVSGDWDPQYFAIQPEERTPGCYINHRFKTSQLISRNIIQIQLEFERPSKYFDVSKFEDAGVTACIVARIHQFDNGGLSSIGHLIHLVREKDGRSELRSRVWLGDYNRIDDNLVMPLWLVNSLGNSQMLRKSRAPYRMAKDTWIHVKEEMSCLKGFLPDFYKNESLRISEIIPFEERISKDIETEEISGDVIF